MGNSESNVLTVQNEAQRIGTWRVPTPEAGYKLDCARVVYFVKIGSMIKIGATLNLLNRLGAFGANAHVLAVAAPGDVGGFVLELFAHKKFAGTLCKGSEYFAPTFDLYEMIDACNRDVLFLVKAYKASNTQTVVNHNHHPVGHKRNRSAYNRGAARSRFAARCRKEAKAVARDHELAMIDIVLLRKSILPPSLQLAADITRAVLAPPPLALPDRGFRISNQEAA